MRDTGHRSVAVQIPEDWLQGLDIVIRKVCLGQQNAVCQCNLFDCFRFAFERLWASDAVDRGHDLRQREIGDGDIIDQQALDNWCWIRKATRFNEHAGKWWHCAGNASGQKVIERRDEITAHFAAQTAGLQHHQIFIARFDELVIQTNVAELIDDDSRVGKPGLAQQACKYCRLSAAEKTGEDAERDHCGAGGSWAMVTWPGA